MFGGHFWQCSALIPGSVLMVVLRGPYEILRIKPELAICRASTHRHCTITLAYLQINFTRQFLNFKE